MRRRRFQSLDDYGQVEALRNSLNPSAMPKHGANLLPLRITSSPTGSECFLSAVADPVLHCSASPEREPVDGHTSRVPPTPIIARYDGSTSNKHTLPISHRPMSTWNIEEHHGSADRDSCPVPMTPHTAHVEMAPLNTPVSVKRRSNPIVLIRLSRTIREDHAKALDYRERCDLTDDPPQMHVHEDDRGRRRLRARSPGVQPSVRHRTKKGSRGSLAPSAACTDGHKAVGKVWSDRHDNRLLQLRGENELPWKRIAGAYFGGTDPVRLQRRYMALTIGPPSQGRHPSGAGLRRSRRVGHGA
ncbi:hypothetical protein LTR35_018224 [Friedmanniomyces endolithicus]|nr:hypothetical protein LTR35_018224 [Friedmanniomyces endolithicus]KAK0261589.1 hypothetical protein LTS00_018134 [Friedmanniomyces endolithicus]KAK0966983.1 hypothetical protein LTR54_018298 [Friedmanniomyces endolithicus]